MRLVLFALSLSFLAFGVEAANIVSARFVLPTDRYDHCVLGDCTEYGAVEAVLDDGRVISYRLDEKSVFEDIEPRLVPLGLNGRNAVLVVRSYLDKGASLALLDQKGGKLEIVAQSDPIGLAHRWQNPIGVGNFDRDGKLEIATLITPHIGGTLLILERQGNRLVPDMDAYPFSNHRINSNQLDMHEIMDWNGDKIEDIILPDVTHHILKVVSFASGKAEVIAQKEFPKLISGPVIPDGDGVRITFSDNSYDIWSKP